MKKLTLLLAAVFISSTALATHLGLKMGVRSIYTNTTLTVNQVEEDPFGGYAMGWSGTMTYTGGNMTVYIERSRSGMSDQLCAVDCQAGNKLQQDTMTFALSTAQKTPYDVYAHYYPTSLSISDTIRYRFVGADDDFTLTVIYQPTPSALSTPTESHRSVKAFRDGQLVILRDGKAYNLLGSKL